jgi:hypothetical protein
MPFHSGTVGASEVANLLIEGSVFFVNSCKGKCSGLYVQDCPNVNVIDSRFFKNVAFHGATVMPYSSTLAFTRVIFAGNEGARVSALVSSSSTISFKETKFFDYRDSSMLIAKGDKVTITACLFAGKIEKEIINDEKEAVLHQSSNVEKAEVIVPRFPGLSQIDESEGDFGEEGPQLDIAEEEAAAPGGGDRKAEAKRREVPEDAKAEGKAKNWMTFGLISLAILIGVIAWSICRGKKAAANWKGKRNPAGYAGGNWGGDGGSLADVEFSRVPD